MFRMSGKKWRVSEKESAGERKEMAGYWGGAAITRMTPPANPLPDEPANNQDEPANPFILNIVEG